jgi:hypothetical protein
VIANEPPAKELTMSNLDFSDLAAAFAALGLLVIMIEINRRWRRIAENQQRIIDDCSKARLLRSPQTNEHAQSNYAFLKFVIDSGDFSFRGIGGRFEPWAVERVKLFHGLAEFTPQAVTCHNDSNGDGDCEICAGGNLCRPKEAADETARTSIRRCIQCGREKTNLGSVCSDCGSRLTATIGRSP